MWKFFEKLFLLGEEESNTSKKRWVANLHASFVDPTTKEKWLSWQFMLFKDDAGNKYVQASLPKTSYAYESIWNHPIYVDVCIPWLYNGCLVSSKVCSTWVTSAEGTDIRVEQNFVQAPASSPPEKPSAVILKLVKDDDAAK